jgi:hypothetical protein
VDEHYKTLTAGGLRRDQTIPSVFVNIREGLCRKCTAVAISRYVPKWFYLIKKYTKEGLVVVGRIGVRLTRNADGIDRFAQ